MKKRIKENGRAERQKTLRRRVLLALSVLILAFIASAGISAIVCDTDLKVTDFDVKIDRIERPFTAVLLTDLHDKQYGQDNEKLLELVCAQNLDVIFCVGDMINEDADDAEVDRFCTLLERLGEIAPVYVSYGNHEKDYMKTAKKDLAPRIGAAGAVLLDEECVTVEIAGNTICLGGTLGHLYSFGRGPAGYEASPEYKLMTEMQASGLPTIVLAHLPDTIIFAHAYDNWDIDLFLSGHTHGGVIRVPWFGGVYAPMQGWFPEYDAGYFAPGKVQLVISAGLAGHGYIPRIFNRPEVCILHIQDEE